MRSGEAAAHVDLGVAQQVVGGHAAVLEREVRGVGGADAELVLDAQQLEARVRAVDHERLDRRAALARVERRPDHDHVGALAGGHVDLLAVEHVLVAVLGRAVVRMAAESEPASGSVIAIAAHLPS